MRHWILLPFLLLGAVPLSARTSNDLDVGWISRQPEIPYVWNSANPHVEGWPAADSEVTWRAHVRNWSGSSRTVTYRWEEDGEARSTGTVTLAADGWTTVDLPWTWTFDRHTLSFVVDSTNLVSEESETNNSVTVFTDALAVGLWVEQSFYDFMRENQHRLNVGSASFEDWAQRQIGEFNRMAAIAIYPETPQGVLDRWRIQKIVVVPDGALPLAPFDNPEQYDATGTTHPNDADRSVDMSWGFTAEQVDFFDDNLASTSPTNIFYRAGYFLHELGHARYLIDTYVFRVEHVPLVRTVEITENGELVAGTPLMPGRELIFNGIRGWKIFESPDRGLMGSDYFRIDRHSAVAMNLIAGARAVSGHANVPANVGVYLDDLPAENRLTIVDKNGVPVADAEVDIFHGVRWDETDLYSVRFDDLADLHFRTDAKGQVLVGRNPFTLRGSLDHEHLAELVAIVRVRKGSSVAFGFLESRVFNLAYWRGERELAEHTLRLPTLEQKFRRRAVRK